MTVDGIQGFPWFWIVVGFENLIDPTSQIFSQTTAGPGDFLCHQIVLDHFFISAGALIQTVAGAFFTLVAGERFIVIMSDVGQP